MKRPQPAAPADEDDVTAAQMEHAEKLAQLILRRHPVAGDAMAVAAGVCLVVADEIQDSAGALQDMARMLNELALEYASLPANKAGMI